MHKQLFIVEGLRTPFCKFHTDLSDEPTARLGIVPSKQLFVKADVDPKTVDHVVFGCCNQPGDTIGNIARLIGVRTGVPVESPAVTVHRNCASGFEAITYAVDKAQAGKGDVFLVGGVESMSRAPFLFNHAAVKRLTRLSRAKRITDKIRAALNLRPAHFVPDVSLKKAMVDSLCDMNMGQTAELVAREHNVTREEQDNFSETSHFKALAAQMGGRFDDEIIPMHLTEDDCIRSFSGKVVTEDNGPRNDAFTDKLAKLKPVFDRREGTVTAGNASQVTDGGAALLLMTEEGLNKTNSVPIGTIVDYSYTGCDPKRMGLGPVHAVDKLLCEKDISLEDMDLVEINEAFAAQVLACQKELKVPDEKLNVNGGAIALGHPLAATGARLVLSLVKELRRRKLKQGLASLCIGGGQGGALWIQTV